MIPLFKERKSALRSILYWRKKIEEIKPGFQAQLASNFRYSFQSVPPYIFPYHRIIYASFGQKKKKSLLWISCNKDYIMNMDMDYSRFCFAFIKYDLLLYYSVRYCIIAYIHSIVRPIHYLKWKRGSEQNDFSSEKTVQFWINGSIPRIVEWNASYFTPNHYMKSVMETLS